ncbi:MAG: mandelate racemase/muconate lactonizing enzyme family protein [Alphaproteobacteria bacterium]|nr:mandelate racemase/muconate lactonizing enzyme family protein [Alphaproteobacteria bacterium]MBU1279130.1 mandelate racemase/muconate lactonizing enzyme family protein [Alphaproteobacteria bacterium]MBU1572861.1 mandelate racemase/muconate lactonizing enzyme family protein [Alphaproteobacteria bacterium]MBU1827732.1 mandelate racemase/muconate lactonizing enzyme family protein [Alphaproteobacteria bacterium]MBU2077343.1 mandelate racemase/muconate lactonizing enzyme family protein [Alphaprot
MKITSVEVFDIHMQEEIIIPWHPVLVRVTTESGLTGVGEVALAYGIGHSAGAAAAVEVAQRFAIGADIWNREALWEKIYRSSFWAQCGGPLILPAISALDMAIWDIQGKALGVPCYQLLGGKTNEKLRAYASQIQFGWEDTYQHLYKADEYFDVTKKVMGLGYDCVKVDPLLMDREGKRHPSHTKYFSYDQIQMFRERMAAIREAIGPSGEIILEVHSATTIPSALQLGEALEEYGIYYYEEPVAYHDSKLQDIVSRRSPLRMAAGERIFGRNGMRAYMEDRSIEVLQPDIGLVGGLTEAKKMCDYAYTYDVMVQAHVCGSPIGTAAALHLETAIPNFLIHEHHTHATKAYNVELCDIDLQPVDGYFSVPEGPGLGINLNDEVVNRSPKVMVK